MKEGRKPEYPEKTPDDELQKGMVVRYIHGEREMWGLFPVFSSLAILLFTGVRDGATHGVTVSTSAFLACHQCCCAGSSLA